METIRNLILVNQGKFYRPLLRELERLGFELAFDDWSPRPSVLERCFACFVSLYDCMRYPLRMWFFRRRLKEAGVPLVAWNRDAPHYFGKAPWRLDWLDWVRYLDIYATHTLADSRSFADKVLYLANAADIEQYNLRGKPGEVLPRLRDRSIYRYDVSFFGAMDGTRYKEMRARQAFFAELAPRLSERGIRHLFREAAGLSTDDAVALVQSSIVNLNYGASCEYGAKLASGLPERCFGIPACGGFLLCDQRSHARDDFTVGENWVEFSDIDDAVRKIEYYVRHLDEAREIAERCFHHVMEHHTYANRARTLRDAIREWHEARA